MNTNTEESAGRKRSIDQFEILRELGRGGTSVVYLVKSKENSREYAMKLLKPELPEVLHADAGGEFGVIAAELLHTEAEILAELGNGQNGIPAYYGEVYRDGSFAGFLMEYVEGESLQKLLSDGRVFTIREAAETGVQLCSILTRLHEMEPPRIYRDLKPGNILVRGDGSCVLVDYGAVRAYRRGAAEDTHPLGTEGYAAPEQYGGWEQSDTRTDVYGVGAVLHHMLTGKPPFETGLRTIVDLMEGDGAPMSNEINEAQDAGAMRHHDVSKDRQLAEMDKIIIRACSVAPSMRYPSCRELENALSRLCGEGAEMPFGWGWSLFLGKCPDKESAWKRFATLAYASLAFLAGAGLLGATAFGAEMSRYRALISEAEELGSWDVENNSNWDAENNRIRNPANNISWDIKDKTTLDRRLELLQQAIKIRPQDSEAYVALLRGLSSDGVLTNEEKEVMEDFLYENGYPGKMREWRPAEYAGLEMELGKVYFGCYEGGTEAARRAFINAEESAGLGREDRKTARAMCEVLGETWTADRIGAWKDLVRTVVSLAVRTGDGTFAAAVCTRAAGEIALFPDKFVEAGADPDDLRDLAKEVREFAQALKSGWPEAPEKTARELETAAEAAWRVCGGE